MARQKLAVLVGILFAALLFAGVGLAINVHTVGEWYHGLGDGSNNNDYVHPFNDNTNNHTHCSTVEIFRYSTRLYGIVSCTSHVHFNWDTSPYVESVYKSRHEATGTHPLNRHMHCHHSGCPT